MTTSSGECFADVGDVTLCYETFGDAGDPPIVLVMGVASQMVAWHHEFCRQLADRGRFVVRFDNRDVGRSSRVDAPPPSSRLRMLTGRDAAYTLQDNAADTIGLLDHLGLADAHLVGLSMGGMIVQEVALAAPERVRSLTIFGSTPGMYANGLPTRLQLRYPPTPDAMRALLTPAPRDRDAYVERARVGARRMRVDATPQDVADIEEVAGLGFDRGISLAGFARQFAAISASPDRLARLRDVRVPTLVLHGADDPVIRPGHARATAAAIPGSRLVMVPGLGHGLPRSKWPEIIGAIDALVVDTERVLAA